MSSPLIGEICAKPDEDGKINKCGEKKKKKWRQGYWHAAVCLEERRNARETRQGSRKTWAGTSECDTDATLMTHLVQCDNQGGWGVKMAQRDQLVAVREGKMIFFFFKLRQEMSTFLCTVWDQQPPSLFNWLRSWPNLRRLCEHKKWTRPCPASVNSVCKWQVQKKKHQKNVWTVTLLIRQFTGLNILHTRGSKCKTMPCKYAR